MLNGTLLNFGIRDTMTTLLRVIFDQWLKLVWMRKAIKKSYLVPKYRSTYVLLNSLSEINVHFF